ncbi:MAG TPA: GIDE domain-containing protein [Candidatus Binatia bacterium]|nr:GIDE domain-containing protein [Candidatus Binatia bacterium]
MEALHAFAGYLAGAPGEHFFWWTFTPAAGAAVALLAGFIFLKRERLIEDTPTSRIRSAAQGFVELEGRARVMQGPPIVSPLTATPCVWWCYRVERKRTDDRGRTTWDTIDHHTSDDCFLLDDGTGTCVVDPVGARVIPRERRTWYGTTPMPHSGPRGGMMLGALFGDYRYTEELIYALNPVYVLGGFRTQSGGPAPADEQADLAELLAKWRHDKRMMALFDTNKDGQVDQKEWEAARRMALKRVREQQAQDAGMAPDLDVVAQPRDGRPFILSAVPQAQLVRRFRLYSAGCMAGFFGAGSFTVYALLARGLL